MAIPNLGTVRNSQLKTEFRRNTNPSPLSIYYRGGSYVPASIPGTPIPGSSGGCSGGQPRENGTASQYPAPGSCWCPNGNASYSCVTPSYSRSWNSACSAQCTNSVGFNWGCSGSASIKNGSGSCWMQPGAITSPPTPPQPGTPTPINSGVPTSGTLKHSNFYGSRKA